MKSFASSLVLLIVTLAFSANGFLVHTPMSTRPSSVGPLLPSPSLPQPVATLRQTSKSRMAQSQDDNDNKISSPLDQPALALLDAVSLLAFAAVGKASHTGANGSIDIGAVAAVAFPFLLSWFATSPFTGVYSKNDDGVLQTTLKGWIVAIPLGCVLRGVIKGYVPPLPFVIVTMIATLVVLGGTRFVYSKVSEGTD
jgi:hypothetical protein